MDKILIKKEIHEDNLIKLLLDTQNQYISVKQECYIEDELLRMNANKVLDFLSNNQEKCYVEFGIISSEYTPAFSILLSKVDMIGHFNLEFNCEICDDIKREHRCKFFIKTDSSSLKNFFEKILNMSDENGADTAVL